MSAIVSRENSLYATENCNSWALCHRKLKIELMALGCNFWWAPIASTSGVNLPLASVGPARQWVLEMERRPRRGCRPPPPCRLAHGQDGHRARRGRRPPPLCWLARGRDGRRAQRGLGRLLRAG
jgi:hypothetical protein